MTLPSPIKIRLNFFHLLLEVYWSIKINHIVLEWLVRKLP